MSFCNKCKVKKINRNIPLSHLQCTVCNQFYHSACVNMTESDVGYIKKDKNYNWSCLNCSKKKRQSMCDKSLVDNVNESAVSEENENEFVNEDENESKLLQNNNDDDDENNDITDDIENINDIDVQSIDSLDHKNTHIMLKKIVRLICESNNNFNCRFDSLESNINRLITENKDLKSRVQDLELKLDRYDQNNLSDSVDIIGVPVLRDENVPITVCKILKTINVNITNTDIKSYKRFDNFPNGDPGKIVVRFKSTEIKNDIFTKKKKKTLLSTIISNKEPSNKMFINESLTRFRRRLFAEVKKLKKSGIIKFAWTKNGTILIKRREEDDSATRITCFSDLKRFKSSHT